MSSFLVLKSELFVDGFEAVNLSLLVGLRYFLAAALVYVVGLGEQHLLLLLLLLLLLPLLLFALVLQLLVSFALLRKGKMLVSG